MNRILCIGHSSFDFTYLMPHYPVENQKYKVMDRKIVSGGPAGNAAFLLAKYGEKVSYITRLGNDFFGEKILEELNSIGIDTKNVIISDEVDTPCSMIIANFENGSRTILNYRKKYKIEEFEFNYINKPEILFFDSHELDIALKACLEFPDTVRVLDASSVKESTLALADKVDYFICSEDFAKQYCSIEEINSENYNFVLTKIEEINKKIIIVTLGEKGSITKINGEIRHFETFKSKAIDTTGAGDIFHGAFVYGLTQKFNIEDNIIFSSACASLSVEKLGGSSSIPKLKEIENKIKNFKL